MSKSEIRNKVLAVLKENKILAALKEDKEDDLNDVLEVIKQMIEDELKGK